MPRKRSAACFTRASNSAALEGMVSTPPPPKRSLTSGMARILTTSPFNLSMTGSGVPFGANSAVQLEASTSLTPVSCSVGHSGLNLDRLAIVTANTRDAAGLDVRSDRRARQHAERNVAAGQRRSSRRAALVWDMLEAGAGIERHPFQHDLIDA